MIFRKPALCWRCPLMWGSFWSPNKMEKQILTDEIQDPEFLTFAIENYSKMFGYIVKGQLNIRIHRDIEGLPPIASLRKLGMGVGEMWFGEDNSFSYYIDFKIIFVRLLATLLNRVRFVSVTIFVF